MTATEHNKIVAIGLAAFAAIFAFTFVLLIVVSVGVFAALGITAAKDPENGLGPGIEILGGVVTVVFYGFLIAVFVVPPALAAWKMLKHRKNARRWGILGAVFVLPIMPLGTAFGIYGLWFLFSPEGKRFYFES
jgi:hypothetical protein